MLTRAVLIIIAFILCCNCDKNVDRIFESRGIASRFNEILQNSASNSTRCVLDIIDTINAVLRNEMWAMKMVDASGKINSQLLDGNIVNLGSFTECLSVKGISSSNNEILGKYCLSFLFITSVQKPVNISYGLSNDVRRVFNKSPGIPLIQAVCLPNSCTAEEITNLLNSTEISNFFPVNIIFDEAFCTPHENHYEFTYLHWITLILIIGALIFIVLSTLYELCLVKLNSKPYHEILISFSLYSNLKSLYLVRKDPDQLSCINGIRTLSMMWIVLGHKYLLYSAFPHVNYLTILNEWLKETSSAFVIGAMFSVDTFFLISGLLIVYVVLLAKEKQFNFNLIHYYVHREFRLFPAFFMAILFYMTFLKYTSAGPLWPLVYKYFQEPCEKNWWYSLLYIQNILNLENVCVNQSWYLAVDTQLYILAPLLFLSIQRWPKPTIIIIVILTFCSCIFGFSIAWKTRINGRFTEITKEFQILYSSIFYRCNSWLIGALLGYYLFIKRGKKVKISKVLVLILWTMSIFTMLSMVLMEEYFFQYEYNIWITSTYFGLSKTLWSISLSWIIFACLHGYGGVVNTFLSMKLFMVLGRLTYSIYIIHIAYLAASIFHGETNTFFSNSSTLYEYISDYILVIIIAHIWTLSFESPLISIGKILLPKQMSKRLVAIHEENENMSGRNTAL